MSGVLDALLLVLALLLGGERGEASWYARGLKRPDALTAASRTWPRGKRLLVIHPGNRRAVVVRVNDYGPEAWTGRVLDLSRGAAQLLGIVKKGYGEVIILPLGS